MFKDNDILILFPARHLDGAVLESLARPHLLITDAYNALNVQARRKERDQALLSEYECNVAIYMYTCVSMVHLYTIHSPVYTTL